MERDFRKEFKSLWSRLGIQSHIVRGLKKKMNGKQALDLSEKLYRELQEEIVRDLDSWYRIKSAHADVIDEDIIRNDVLCRINTELAKHSVPLLSWDILS